MKKIAGFMLALAVLVLLSCGGQAEGSLEAGETVNAVSADTLRKGPTVRRVLESCMPEAMTDGIVKVAVVLNHTEGDLSWRFTAACVSEGRSMGFTVDTFLTDGEHERCREIIRRIAGADYDGLILTHGGPDFTYSTLMPILDKGIKVVTYNVPLPKNGDSNSGLMPGITSTIRGDETLARLSLEAILSHFDESGKSPGSRPVRVIRAWFGPGIPELDLRQRVFDEFVREGKIEEVALVSPKDLSFARREVKAALTAALTRLPEGTVDAVWASHDDFAEGCADALYETGRLDIALVSIGISNDNIKLMLNRSAVWLCAAVEDPGLVGVVDMRLLAAKLAGETVPDTYVFEGKILKTASLSPTVTMANITVMLPDWGWDTGIFDQYPWMTELKTAESKYLRLSPVHSEESL
ncbi:MAG: substrate-binding domain-containing protein [Treponema sp.]|jgi:simple sugar transport system substrate-binding protein|nr:substrate-binding domain-containing protein [Treponema sp.]